MDSIPERDMKELFRRTIFNILISNTDDHLRNHGFLYENKKGWKLSPIYDINPVPSQIKGHILSTNIDFNSNYGQYILHYLYIEEFRLSRQEAIIK
jgi:serine/threonine-protein kinase HipA